MAATKAEREALRRALPRERLEQMLQAQGYYSISMVLTQEGHPVSESTVKALTREYGITPPRQGMDWLGKRNRRD